jgi:ATP-binding cassette subfamily F protein 2
MFSCSLHDSKVHLLTVPSLLDKIAKDIMVCEHKTVTRWDGSIGEYKNHLRKKMSSTGVLA